MLSGASFSILFSNFLLARPTKSAHKRKGEASKQEIRFVAVMWMYVRFLFVFLFVCLFVCCSFRCQHIGDEELQKLCGILSVEILELE